jgi:hypothetical protein
MRITVSTFFAPLVVAATVATMLSGCSPSPALCAPLSDSTVAEAMGGTVTGSSEQDVSDSFNREFTYECMYEIEHDSSPVRTVRIHVSPAAEASNSVPPEGTPMPSWSESGYYAVYEGTASSSLSEAQALQLGGSFAVGDRLWSIDLITSASDEANELADFPAGTLDAMVSQLDRLAQLIRAEG